ncbi:MAG: type IV pilus assembly protein PilM [Bacillota bacterium]
MFFKRKNSSGLGIDIGSKTIKAIEIENTGMGCQVKTAVRGATPQGTVADGIIVDASRLASALSDLVEGYGWRGRSVVSAIGGRKVVTRHIRVPVMPEKELLSAVKWEAEKYLPAANQEMVMDFKCLGEINAGGNKQLLIIVATLPLDIAHAYYDLFASAQLKLVAIDIVPLALMRWATSPLGNAPSDTNSFALAELGAETTHLVIAERGQIAFARTIPLGGAQVAKLLSTALEQSFPEVLKEDQKQKKTGLPNDYLQLGEAAASLGETRVDVFLQSSLAELVRELRRSLDFYRTQAPNSQMDKILLTGGLSLLPGIKPFLHRELDRIVEIGVIHSQTAGAHTLTLDAGFSLATGLALREVVG